MYNKIYKMKCGQNMRKNQSLTVIALVLVIATLFTGCNMVSGARAKDFGRDGIRITLNENFYEKEHISYLGYYEASDMIVLINKESVKDLVSYDLLKEDSTTADYAELIIGLYQVDATVHSGANGSSHFEYEKEIDGNHFKYYAYAFKGESDFYLVQFAIETKNIQKLESKIDEYVKSIVIG